MADLAEIGTSTEVVKAVEKIQNFVPGDLARVDELGRALSLNDAVPPATRIVSFFRQIPVEHIHELSKARLDELLRSATDTSTLFQELLTFNPTVDNAHQVRQNLIDNISNRPDQIFDLLKNTVSYLASRQRDYSALAEEAKKARDEALRDADELRKRLSDAEAEAKRILDEVRRTAAEQGVAQQAQYFHTEATEHSLAGDKWQGYTVWTAIGLGIFAFASLALGRVFLVPTTPYEMFQIGLSKVLIFATIAYMLFLCARTLTAHRHNAVVNRHRQNALLTFNALVDASGTETAQDVVLNHAAACIFAPQDSGFTKAVAPTSGSPIIELLPKALPKVGG